MPDRLNLRPQANAKFKELKLYNEDGQMKEKNVEEKISSSSIQKKKGKSPKYLNKYADQLK